MNQRDRDNNTPLHWACQESHFDIVGVLMSRNAAVDPVNDLQSTPLHYACREVRLLCLTSLLFVDPCLPRSMLSGLCVVYSVATSWWFENNSGGPMLFDMRFRRRMSSLY